MRGSKTMVMLAALAGSCAAGQVSAQTRWDLPSAGWPSNRCIAVSTYAVFPCGNMDLFLTARVPIAGKQVCCQALNISTTDTLSVSLDSKFTTCGAEWTVKVQASRSETTTMLFDGASPCGCVQLYWEQDFRVRKQRTTYSYCVGPYNNPSAVPSPWTEERIIKDKVPNGGRVTPYYYQPPQTCSGCGTDGRPLNPETPAPSLWDPNTPGGFPAQIPNARPHPEAIPWNTPTHGNPNFDVSMPSDGSGKQVTIDLQEGWKPRKIPSALSLNLFECGWIVQSLAELRHPSVGGGDQTQVEVLVADGVRLAGTLAALEKDLYKYANAMVNDKAYGDFNEDGNRDGTDLQLLQDQIMTGDDLAVLRLYDVNGDGGVDAADLTKWHELVGP